MTLLAETCIQCESASRIRPNIEITKLTSKHFTGKGAMFVHYGFQSHIVAFEDGIIYDPAVPKEQPWRQWLEEQEDCIEFVRIKPIEG